MPWTFRDCSAVELVKMPTVARLSRDTAASVPLDPDTLPPVLQCLDSSIPVRDLGLRNFGISYVFCWLSSSRAIRGFEALRSLWVVRLAGHALGGLGERKEGDRVSLEVSN
jgi:hypothetical protein